MRVARCYTKVLCIALLLVIALQYGCGAQSTQDSVAAEEHSGQAPQICGSSPGMITLCYIGGLAISALAALGLWKAIPQSDPWTHRYSLDFTSPQSLDFFSSLRAEPYRFTPTWPPTSVEQNRVKAQAIADLMVTGLTRREAEAVYVAAAHEPIVIAAAHDLTSRIIVTLPGELFKGKQVDVVPYHWYCEEIVGVIGGDFVHCWCFNHEGALAQMYSFLPGWESQHAPRGHLESTCGPNLVLPPGDLNDRR